ncbi:hypothetical protein NESM_000151600 [Novymonas esmeraldas]|uniref:Uncharacterized protein n=1 Tax=Novymonas esmeraldas TaxID=1808958 RepID=A0AAW0F2Y8_9TRYP
MSAGAKGFIKNVAFPVIGFGLGWVGFTAVEQNGLLGESTQRWLNVCNLKLQLRTQRLLPASVVEKYGYPEDTLQSMISYLEKGYSETEVADRMTFDEVLRQCPVPEQMAYLEEHALEEIPYFYIADIFHSWANLNAHTILRQPQASPQESDTGSAAPLLRNDDAFDSEVLCHALWDKMILNVIPFDVSIRALCALAVNNRANARRLALLSSPERVVELYNDYTDKRQSDRLQGGSGSDVVAPAEVAAATLFFLRAVNDASVHKRWVPLLGAPSTGPYPLARRVPRESWCRAFGSLTPAITAVTADTAVLLADVVSERLRCEELRGAESPAPSPS